MLSLFWERQRSFRDLSWVLPDCTLIEGKDSLELVSHHTTAVMSRFWSGFRVYLGGVEPRSESSNPLAHTASRLFNDDSPSLA